jgi:nucleoid DNA-binding protein
MNGSAYLSKSSLVDLLVSRTALKRADVERVMASLTEICLQEVAHGTTVSLVGLGRLSVCSTPRKQFITGFKGERLELDRITRFQFRASAQLRAAARANGKPR